MTENNTIMDTTELEFPSFLDFSNMPSMDELIGNDTTVSFGEGSIVTGVIVEIRDSGLIVDIGYKAEGFIPKDEFLEWRNAAPGDEVRAILETLEDEKSSMPVLSVQKAIVKESWDAFLKTHEEGAVVKGTVKHRVKGGFMIDIGIDAFLPGSQVDVAPVRNLDELVGQECDFKILKINMERCNIVVSRRELLEEAKSRQRAAMMAEILPGQIRKGVVKNITDFGAFIDLIGIDGLLHITDMSWGRVSHPSELLEINQEVEAIILDVDREKDRVSLGLKQKTQDPWESVEERYPKESRIKGRVVNVMPYGAFVEIEQGVEGLIHISEMSWTKRVTRASDILSVGDEVEAVVLDMDRGSKKISLGLRQTMENPWGAAARECPPGTKVKGKVRNLTSYGAFIEIRENIDGMVHVSDMSWTRKINNPSELLKRGDDIEAIVLDIDPAQQRISLGIKQLEQDPWENIDDIFAAGNLVSGTVRKLTNFGAFVKLSHDIDGLIHISQISDERVEKVKDYLKVGDEVEAQIIKIDKGERRIGLSLKETKDSSEPQKQPRQPVAEERLKPGEQMVDVGNIFDNAIEASESTTEDAKASTGDDAGENTENAAESDADVEANTEVTETKAEAITEVVEDAEAKVEAEEKTKASAETETTAETEAGDKV